MDGYLGNFFEHGGQVVSLLTVAAVWLGFSALGVIAGGRKRLVAATPLYGWAVVSFAVTVLGVFTAVPFTYVAAVLAVAAVAAGIAAARRDDALLAPGLWRLLVLAAPLLLLVSAMAGSQWDEFADWLISPRQMLILDAFPDNTNKHMGGSLAAYPYGWHVVTYLASRLAGRLVENAGALFNVLLLLSFGVVVVGLVRDALEEKGGVPGWGLAALSVLAVTLLNPTFSQKIVLTSYADTASGVCVGFGVVLGWRLLGALAAERMDAARRLAWEIGLVMLVLVNLKQATAVLMVMVIGGIVLVALRDPAIRLSHMAGMLPRMVVPAVVIYAVWRVHVVSELTGAELSVRPVGEWYFHLLPDILGRMVLVFSKKGAYFAVMIAALVCALRALGRPETPFDRLALIAGFVFAGYNAFLLFSYVAVFGEMDARRVASLWRYNMHLGPMAVAFAAHGLALLWRRFRLSDRIPAGAAWAPVVLVLVAPLVFTHKLRFDRHPPVPFFRAVSADLRGRVEQGDRLFVVDPGGSGESAMIARYELANLDVVKGYLGAFHPRSAKALGHIFEGGRFSHLLVHSPTPDVIAAAGLPLEPGTSYLLVADGAGWRVVHAWKAPTR